MNATKAENLRILIRHMETKVTRTLDMDRYGVCGAPACAIGEACVCPDLAHLRLPTPGRADRMDVGPHFVERYEDNRRLFASRNLNAWRSSNVTPQEWATEARKVLAENGYSMEPEKPAYDFPAFMAKVQEPVLTEREQLAERINVSMGFR